MKKYFQLTTSEDGTTADLDIYGDICARWWDDDVMSASKLSKMLDELGDVSQINVHINSYGGEVAEGLAIYSALRRHKARVRTTCDGFACSIASVIFMAGDERLMSDASLLMIHNAWTSAIGVNAADLRKLADDMDTITSASKSAYMARVSITEDELTDLMDAETWIGPSDAVDMGFATEIETFESGDKASQGARDALMALVMESVEHRSAAKDDDDDPDDTDDGDGTDDNGDDSGTDGGNSDSDDDEGDGDGADGTEPDDEPEDPEKDPDKKQAFAGGIAAFASIFAN
ncbi:head maturation protease, ClpP-related [Collinsella sp. LCP19S3_B11]|uniref:head maturation protease, ClpP-related n=1 Tax=Collinsella sp. LCP19S3_B11 TaxID=3438754 RepID=UPI003F8E91FA